jgi:hypothetical protein
MKLFFFFILISSTNVLSSFCLINKGIAGLRINTITESNKESLTDDEENGSFQFVPSSLLLQFK